LHALDNKKCVLLVLLDLSAAFDTIDHATLLSRLKDLVGLEGKAFEWFDSYIHGRGQSVQINLSESKLWELLFGVPQGSVLGPLLFIIYTSPLGRILRAMGVQFHLYADDTQIYLSFDIKNAPDAATRIEEVIRVIRVWMAKNFLRLNDDKTEVLVIGSRAALPKVSIDTIQIGNKDIHIATEARNIGFVFDNTVCYQKQVSLTVRAAWFHLRNIGKIRQYLDNAATERLIHAFITSKLDVNNCLLYGLPDTVLSRLQLVQNAAARMVTRTRKAEHITPVLMSLHWLPVHQRIVYKLLLLTYKALHGLAPSYLSDLLTLRENTSRSSRANDQNLLVAPRSNTKTYGDRDFRVAAPRLWNNLPLSIRKCQSLDNFKILLKTHLFNLTYE
jgi:hypothetical protein